MGCSNFVLYIYAFVHSFGGGNPNARVFTSKPGFKFQLNIVVTRLKKTYVLAWVTIRRDDDQVTRPGGSSTIRRAFGVRMAKFLEFP
jgi:hypothetical protein